MLLENKNAVTYGWHEVISGAVARTFANFTSGTFPSYMTPDSMTTQRQGKRRAASGCRQQGSGRDVRGALRPGS